MKQLPAAAGETVASARTGTAALLLMLAGGPVAVAVAMLVNLMLIRAGCTTAATAARIGLVLLALAGSAFACMLAWQFRRRLDGDEHDPKQAAAGRDRFLAFFALAASAGSILVALYFTAVVLFLDLCWFA